MAQIKGTNVAAPIVPFDTADVHPSHEARYGKGGYRTVATLVERDAIPPSRREAGMLVHVVADGKVYRLADDLTAWAEFKSGASTWTELEGKPTAFPPETHQHVVGDVTGLQTALDGKAASSHSHGSITSDGKIGTETGQIVVTTTGGSIATASGISGGQVTVFADKNNSSALSLGSNAATFLHHLNDNTIDVAFDEIGASLSASKVTGLAAVATSGSYDDLDDLPTLFDGAYSSLSGLPTLGSAAAASTSDFAAASHAHAWSDITSGVPSTFSPSSHTHGNLSNDGLVNGNTTSGQIVVTTTGGALTTSATIGSSAVSGLGGAATLNVGTTAGTVAAGDHTHTQLHDRSHAITSSADHTATNWRLFHSNGSGQVVELAFGNSGQALISQGASAAPTWGQAGSTSASDLTSGTLANARMTTRARAAMNLYLWSAFR